MNVESKIGSSNSDRVPKRFSIRCYLGPAAVVVVAAVLVFGQIYQHEFLTWDDDAHIHENPHIHPVSLEGLKRIWTEPFFGLYIPVSYTVFAGEAYLGTSDPNDGTGPQISPHIFSLGSLLLHVLCALLVLKLLNRLVSHPWAACAGALLFAIHPLQVESVAWISETRGLLCSLFSLFAIWQFLCFNEEPAGSDSPRASIRVIHYLLATVAFALALLSKPAAVSLPLVILVIDVGLLRHSWKRSATGLSLWIPMAVAVVWLSQSQQVAEMQFLAPLWARPLIAADVVAFYLYKLLLPLGLGPDYGRPPEVVIGQWWCYFSWMVPAALLVLLVRFKGRVWLAAAGISVAALLPVLGLVPFGFQDISTVADRYCYLAMLGPALALAALLAKWNQRAVVTATILLLSILAVLSFRQTAFWRDSATLFTRGLQLNPRSLFSHNNLGTILREQGKFEVAAEHFHAALDIDSESVEALTNLSGLLIEEGKLGEAEILCRRALNIEPGRVEANVNLGAVLAQQGRLDDAISCYYAVLAVQPRHSRAHNNLGVDLMAQGQPERALGHFQQAVRYEPTFLAGRKNLAAALRDRGALEEAREHLVVALNLDPRYADAHTILGTIESRMGNYRAAAASLRKALEISPDHALAAAELAWLLATCPDAEVRDGDEAVRLAEALCRATDNQNPHWLDTLAAAYAEQGDYTRALQSAELALGLAQAQQNLARAARIQSRIRLYQAGKPCRATVP